jgi:hypothetical protein
MTWWNFLVGVVVVIGVIVLWLQEHIRAYAIRHLARRLSLTYLGKRALPGALSLYGTPFNDLSSSSVSNLIDGERGKIRVIAFDCRVGAGKGSWQRTVIAARSESDVFGGKKFNPDLAVDRSAAWQILYYPRGLENKGLMPVAELEAHLEAIDG